MVDQRWTEHGSGGIWGFITIIPWRNCCLNIVFISHYLIQINLNFLSIATDKGVYDVFNLKVIASKLSVRAVNRFVCSELLDLAMH